VRTRSTEISTYGPYCVM